MVVDSTGQLDVNTWGVMWQSIQKVLTLMNCPTLNWKPYADLMGTKSGDLIFFLDPGQTLANDLHLITSDHNVLFMVASHKSDNVVHLFVVSFREDIVDVEDCKEDDENENVTRANRNDPWWQDKLSDNEDIFDVDLMTLMVGLDHQKQNQMGPM